MLRPLVLISQFLFFFLFQAPVQFLHIARCDDTGGQSNDANAEHRGNDAEGLAQVGHGRKIAIAHRAQRDGSPVESIKKVLVKRF